MFLRFINAVIIAIFFAIQSTTTMDKKDPYCALECDFGFAKYSHTVCNRKNVNCGASPDCGPDFQQVAMTEDLRRGILDLHNDYRQKVASGRETRHHRQPTASNMLQMIYSDELQNISQCWSNACKGNPLVHDQCRRTMYDEHVGQNLGFYNDSGSNFDIENITLKLVKFWFDEVLDYKREWVKDTKDRSPHVIVGHYTQLIWADSLEVGCAITKYTTPNVNPNEYPAKWNHLLLACDYGPGGNYLGQSVYMEGSPCSRCPSHTHCGHDVRTNALCVLDYDTNDSESVDKEQIQKKQEIQENRNKDLVQKLLDLFYF